LFFFIPPASIVAVIFGHLSLSEIRKSAGRLKGDGLAITGLVLGYAGLAVIPVLIIAAIAIPNLLRARMAANESSAVAAVRTLNVAEVVYSQAQQDAGYTCALSDLDRSLDRDLASGRKNGYVFELKGLLAWNCGRPQGQISSDCVSVGREPNWGAGILFGWIQRDQGGGLRFGAGLRGEWQPTAMILRAVCIRTLCGAIVLFGIARNLPLHPFDWLAPGAMLHF
jgi:hypothetical protein